MWVSEGMSVNEVVRLIAGEGWKNWKMKPCICPKKIPLVTMNQGCKCHLLVCLKKRFRGMWLLLLGKKKKDESESMRPGDSRSAIVTCFSFSCSAICLAQDLTPTKTHAALIHTWGIFHYIMLSLVLSLKSSCSFQAMQNAVLILSVRQRVIRNTYF